MLSFVLPSDAVLIVDMITGLEMEQSCVMLLFYIYLLITKKITNPSRSGNLRTVSLIPIASCVCMDLPHLITFHRINVTNRHT